MKLLKVTSTNTYFKKIANAYYIAKGIMLPDETYYYKSVVTDGNNIYDIIVARSNIDKPINDILFVDDKITYLCVLPEDIFTGEARSEATIAAIWHMYEFLLHYMDNRHNSYTFDIYNKVLDIMSKYLTVKTLTTWYAMSYSQLHSYEKSSLANAFTEEQFDNICNIPEEYIMDYQYIYGMLYPVE